MSSEIPDSDKVQLLFKEFTGVTNVKQSTAFPGENFAFTDYIFGNRVFNEDIPTNLPSGLQSIDLDSCGNIIDGDFIDLPEYKLRFYKKLKLDPAEPGSLKSWYISDGSGGSILKDAIPFKYDPVNSSYRQFCYRRTSVGPPATYFQIQQYSNPTFWFFDYKSGFLEFYGDEATLTPYFTATDGPHFSFFKYIGEKGASGGGGDASGNLDLSGNLSVGGDVDISGNLSVVGDADFCNVLVRCDLDVSGNTDLSQNLLQATASTDLTPSGITDYNAYFRQSNMIDSMKLPFDIYFLGFWKKMADRSRGIWRPGNTSPFGPNLIPIAKININNSYNSGAPAATNADIRPILANTIGYFTVKFSQPSMNDWTENRVPAFSINGVWSDALGAGPVGSKPGYNCVPEQTIHFIAGYQEQEYDLGGEIRNPKPFIKVLSSSFGDIRNVNGNVVEFVTTPVLNGSGSYSGNKIGGITRIILAEGLLNVPLLPGQKGIPTDDQETNDKAWLLLEQTWAYEPWISDLTTQENVLTKICQNHSIDVRLFNNNTGALMQSRPNGPNEMAIGSELNTDWQLLSSEFIQNTSNFIQNWDAGFQPSFLLQGLPNTVFNPPLDVINPPNPPSSAITTLFVGGQQNPPGVLTTGQGETSTNKYWFVDLNVYDWPYGITTTKEIFKYNVDICGNLTIDGNIEGDLTVNGDLNVTGNGSFDGTLTTVGNTTLVEYRHYDNTDFTTDTTLKWDTIAVSEHETGTSDRASYAEFHLYDNTTNADSTILVFSVSKLVSNNVTINVKEINWNTSSQCIEKIRIKFGSVVSNRRAEIQIYHKRISSSINPTSLDIRMYTNLSKSDSITDILPWKLSSDNQSYSNNITELDLTNNNNNNNSSAYQSL